MSSWAPSEFKAPKSDPPVGAQTGTSWEPTEIKLLSKPGPTPDPTGPKMAGIGTTDIAKFGIDKGANLLPVALGAASSLVGPEGTPVGAGVGSVLRDLIQKNIHGEQAPSFGENALTFGKNAVMSGIGGKVSDLATEAFPGPVQSRVASALANAVFGQSVKGVENSVNGNNAPTTPIDLAKDFGINLGLDIVGSKVAKMAVGRTAAGKSEAPTNITVGEGFGKLRDEISGTSGTPQRSQMETGESGRTAILDKLKGITDLEKRQYKAFRDNHVANNVEEIPQLKSMKESAMIDPSTNKPYQVPEIENVKVNGPIHTVESTLLAGSFKSKTDAFIRGKEFQTLPEDQQKALTSFDNLIDKLTTGTPSLGPDGKTVIHIPVLEYETAKQLKTAISQDVGGIVNKTLGQGGLTKLVVALDKDIDNSVSGWKNGKQALQDLNAAHTTTEFKKTVYGKEITDRVHGANPTTGQTDSRVLGDPSQIFHDAYKSREATQRTLKALGDENKPIMRQDYMDNELLPKTFGANFSKFKPREAINELEDPNSVTRDLYSSDQRNSMLRFFRAAESTPEGKGLSFGQRTFSMVLGLAGKGITGNQYVGSSVRIASRDLMQAMSDKPEIAEVASRLIKIPSDSTEGQLLVKRLMKGLRGSMVTVDINGKEKQAKVNEAGKLIF